MSEHWQYLLVLAACLAITAPLEFFGNGVYRQPLRLLKTVLPVAAVFLLWDEVAVAAGIWTYDPCYISGLSVPFRVPVEEVLFFVVIPICALLTYNAIGTILERRSRQ